ncbi:MAG TPA: gluconate 2-dehydrogenase subunit 3 family protein [Pseudolabrys sp.]|jgi:gluconate 2-dehydrogenase gamma chain|nr:gluconate 2-dehydrogenase subunit 3 family protein [Pseudolabrys sp.]
MADDTIPRRRFLLGAGLAGTAVAAGLASEMPLPAQAEASSAATPPAASPASAEPEALLLLTATEAAFVSAAVDAFIPADDLSPSGSDCGLVIYIDRQLASEWGGGAKMYRGGPFHKGKPEQGYQLALTPRQFFQTGITEANAWSHKTYGKEFDRLAPADRDAALKAMEEGKAAFGGVSSRMFFNMLLSLAMDGFFADPAYGGNRNAASWKMLGFPGLPATYADKFEEYRNKRYIAPPRSMADFS